MVAYEKGKKKLRVTAVGIAKDTLVMKRFDKRKLLAEFKDIRASVQRKLSDREIVGEIKRSRKA